VHELGETDRHCDALTLPEGSKQFQAATSTLFTESSEFNFDVARFTIDFPINFFKVLITHCPIMAGPPPFEVLTTTAAELQGRLKSGSLTSLEIISTYLAQIKRHNHAGAKLNAMITVAPKELVLKAAEKLDRERSAGKVRGTLHGLPIIVKV
jgi:hypothetical protein